MYTCLRGFRVLKAFRKGGWLAAILVVALSGWMSLAAPVAAQSDLSCGKLVRDHGPFDYTNARHRARHLGVVEKHHFTDDVRNLRRGATTYLAEDLEYVLNWFPNHHRALDAFSRLALRERKSRPNRAKVDIECRFQWARDVQPKDATVLVIEGFYYYRSGRHADARRPFLAAAALDPADPETQYNLGLGLTRLGEHEAARDFAERAYQQGYPLPALRDALKAAGFPLSE